MRKHRLLNAFFCLLVICSLIAGVIPAPAQAAAVFVGVPASQVISSIFIGLGFTVAAADLLQPLIDDCKDFLTSIYDFISAEDKIDLWSTGNPDMPYMVDGALIEAVRTWIFNSDVCTETTLYSVSGFHATSMDSAKNYYIQDVLTDLLTAYPAQTVALLQSLGVNDKVAVLSIGRAGSFSFKGIYFDASGLLCVGEFANPYSSMAYTHFGVYPLADLVLSTSDRVSFVPYVGSSTTYWYSCYATKELAESNYAGTSTALYIDYAGTADTGLFKFYSRNFGSSAFWTEESVTYYLNPKAYYGAKPVVSSVVWSDSTESIITVPDWVKKAHVAAPSVPLEEGYADWYYNSTILTGTEYGGDDDVRVYPITITPTLEESISIPQVDVWTGTAPNTGTGEDEEDKVIAGDMSGHLGQIGGDLGVLDGFTMPNFGDVDVGFDDILDDADGDGISLISEFFEIIFSIEHIYIVFFIAFTLALISFAIFGKR